MQSTLIKGKKKVGGGQHLTLLCFSLKQPVLSARLNQNITPTTHHCLLNIDFLTTGQTEICYLSHKIVPNKNIPRCQIPVDELGPREQRRGGKRCHDKDTDTTILSKIKNEPVNKSEKKKNLVLGHNFMQN